MSTNSVLKTRLQRALSTAILCLGLGGAATAASSPGVVVEEVGKGSALDKAGLRPGDLLLAWERAPDPPAHPEEGKGEIRTVFDWFWVKTEQAPRGGIRLHGEREGAATSFAVPTGFEWDARVRPLMAADLLQTYTGGRQRVEAGDVEGGVSLWDPLLQRVEPDLKCWLLLQVSEAWSKSGQGDKARSGLEAALAEAQDPQTRVALGEALGESYQDANEMAYAEASFRSALEVGETAWGQSLRVASTIARLGTTVRLQNRLDVAEQIEGRALEIRQRWAPDSLEVAESLDLLSGVAWARGDLEAAYDYAQRALTLYAQWAPGSLAAANSLTDWAVAAAERGLFEDAAGALLHARAILEQRSPDSLQMATVLTELGEVARQRNDLDSALELHQRALAIRERLAPESVGTAKVLNYLGLISWVRGDLTAAAKLFQRAMAIWEKAAPNGLGVAGDLDALGAIARLRGDLDTAWKLHTRSLEINERLAPGSIDIALYLRNLARVATARGDLDRGIDLYQQAHKIYERMAPGTLQDSLALQQLGWLYHRTRRFDQAAQYLAKAVDALESQMGMLGGSPDLQATFRARYEQIYRDAIDVELERGHTAGAFHLVERSRARSFLTLLAERDLAFSGEVPEALERSRRDNAARYDQTLRELARWTPKAREESREDLYRELRRLRRERDEIAAEIRKASPRLAALRQPQPLDLASARKVLDPGTLALSYSVGESQTALFAVTRDGGLRVKILPVGEKQLRQDVERFLERVRQPVADTGTADLARSLYRALIAPVADLVGKCERVLILPDGPLHRLPFGALVRDTGGRGQYLTEWKPLHTALSLTVYGTLRALRREPSRSTAAGEPAQLVAFGDPHYPKDLAPSQDIREPALRTLRDLRSFNWTPLPYSRREVERIADVYPEAHLYLGEGATEERAKTVARDARVLHFATHGYLDDRTPLDSALMLTIPAELSPGRDNGLLQVWEIFESVRLDADLVVLSACGSALGRELSGEGLIGLTRAFQYAGARSVAASLWSVSDQVTAELMARFHRHYAAGLPKDEALRQAQIELIRKPIRITTANGQTVETDASAPFFWAAFQLFGDWR
jgi:CHAT domain-containing protein